MSDSSTAAKRILVLCTGNRCRSQMAEGWLRHFAGARGEGAVPIKVFSAGVVAKGVHPLAIQYMAEAGVDISSQQSETMDAYVDQPFDAVVTVCGNAKESCPVFPGAPSMVHQPFEDPDHPHDPDEPLEDVFRRVRDQIKAWAEGFITTLDNGDAA